MDDKTAEEFLTEAHIALANDVDRQALLMMLEKAPLPHDVLVVDLRPQFRMDVAEAVRRFGHESTIQVLIEEGYSESFARVLIRRILKQRGW